MNKIQCNFYKVLYYMVLISPLSIISGCLLAYYSFVEKNELMYNIALKATVVVASPIIILILWALSDYIEDKIRIKDTLDKRNLFDGIIAFQFPADIRERYYKKLKNKYSNKEK